MTQFISEISSNHNSNLKRSLKLINVSSKIGFDIVKFQLFKIDKLFSKEILFKSKNHRDRKKWELKEEYIPILAKECKKNKIKFCVTPFYLEAVDIIKPYVDFIKIASYEILWEDLLVKCAKTKKPIIISTGMANMKEVINAVKILKKNGAKKIIILHCVSNYPAKLKSLNLSAISTLRKKTKLDIGWSDHSAKSLVVYKAIQKWKASFVELHIDLDGKGFEYKSGHCWLPKNAKELINFVKQDKLVDGNGKKKPNFEEISERKFRADKIDGLRPIRKYRK
jgi:N-acetylneuraminate synthase